MKVSALMVTGGDESRKQLADRSVDAFLQQTYQDRELVIINTSPTAPWFKWAKDLPPGSPSIIEHSFPREGRTLGELRNLSLEAATGPLLINWDDDDYYHPQRIEFQKGFHLPGYLTLLKYQYRLDIHNGECGIFDGAKTPLGGIVGTMLFNRTDRRYRPINKEEDKHFSRWWLRRSLVNVVSGPPKLYTRIYHGGNTWNRHHIMQNLIPIQEFSRHHTANYWPDNTQKDSNKYIESIRKRYSYDS